MCSLVNSYRENFATIVAEFYNAKERMENKTKELIANGCFDENLKKLFFDDILLFAVFVSGKKSKLLAYDTENNREIFWDPESILETFKEYGRVINELMPYYQEVIDYHNISLYEFLEIGIHYQVKEFIHIIYLIKYSLEAEDYYASDDYNITEYGDIAIKRLNHLLHQDIDKIMYDGINFDIIYAASQVDGFVKYFEEKYGFNFAENEDFENEIVSEVFLDEKYNFWHIFLDFLKETLDS